MNTVNYNAPRPVLFKHMATMFKVMMIFVGISGCFSVLCGAWLAHGGKTLPASVQVSMATALQYQFIHTIALLICLVWLKVSKPSIILLGSCFAFVLGILCFSGTIYIKAFFDFAIIGKLTPFGGIALAIAWLLLAIDASNRK